MWPIRQSADKLIRGWALNYLSGCAETTMAVFKSFTQSPEFACFTREKEGQWSSPFYFVQGADTQYGMIDGHVLKKPDPKWDVEIELSRKLVKALNQMRPKPRFFVVCGDLLDAFPETDAERRKLQEQDFKAVFAGLDPDIPLVCVCGNHDIGNRPTKETIHNYRKSFGADYFSFWCGGVLLIVINSQYYWDKSLVEDIASEQDTWLDEQLNSIKTSGCKHAVIFQHIPWFLFDANEAQDPVFNIEKGIRAKMLDKFADAGIRTIFCGHYHRNAGGRYKNMELVVTSAIGAQLGSDLPGVRIVQVTEDAITHQYLEIDNLPTTVDFS